MIDLQEHIILDHNILADKISSHRAQGKRIVLTQGSWDLLHIGHARYVREAKNNGDVLVVGVDSDDKVKKRKGPERPVVPEAERMEMIAHLRYVDMVTLKNVDDPKWHLIKTVRPDVLISTKRQEYTPEELEALKEFCGTIIQLDSQATTSTSAKIRLLQLSTAKKLEDALRETLERTFREVLGGK